MVNKNNACVQRAVYLKLGRISSEILCIFAVLDLVRVVVYSHLKASFQYVECKR